MLTDERGSRQRGAIAHHPSGIHHQALDQCASRPQFRAARPADRRAEESRGQMNHRGRGPSERGRSAVTTPDFQLRPAMASDFFFAQTLYMASMKPLLSALDAWDEVRA